MSALFFVLQYHVPISATLASLAALIFAVGWVATKIVTVQ